MKRLSLALALALFPACGDDEVKPGNLVATWTFGGPVATCESSGVASIEARIYSGTKIVAKQFAPCGAKERTGTVALASVKPGTYKLAVEAFDTNAKGLFIGYVARQNVKEGKTTTTQAIALEPKPARVIVDWEMAGGGKCSTLGIREVQVDIYYNANTGGRLIETQRVSCDNIFTLPDDGSERSGVLFDELEPNDNVVIEAFGYDANKKKIAKAISDVFPISIGDEHDDELLTLSLCGDDC